MTAIRFLVYATFPFRCAVEPWQFRDSEGVLEAQMHNEFTAVIERDGDWFVAYCPEIPGANGQGITKDEARESLAEAVALILQDRREDGLRGIPPDAECERITLE